MAQLEFVFQAVTATARTHAGEIHALLGRVQPESVLISVGFVQESGVEAIEEALKAVVGKAIFFVGIRNDITTVQGVKRLLALKGKVYAVDTASRGRIFHPKLYLAIGKNQGGLIIGSANLTFPGLHNNIEASALVTLDLKDNNDQNFVTQTLKAFEDLILEHPEHVFLIRDSKHADELFLEGRLADANVIPAPTPTSGITVTNRDSLPPMRLKQVTRPRGSKKAKGLSKKKTGAAVLPVPIQTVRTTEHYRVWASNELSKRDLNLPSGSNTNRTGSIGLRKGANEDIDHRRFFREEVFRGLVWTTEAKKPYSELAQASFELVVKNLNYGKFELWIRHDARTTTVSYKQHNEMTHLRWGDAIDAIRQPDLLGRTMYLYRKDTNPPEFLIEID